MILNRYTGSSGNVLAELGGWDWSTPSQILNRITLHMDGSIVIGSGGNNFLQLTNSDAVLVRNGTVKSFVIPHPLDDPDRPERWLVHGCTESPVAGVEYTGTAEVDELAAVTLPDYFDALVEDDGRTVQVTVVDDGGPLALVAASPIEGGRFFIRTNADRPVRVHWHVRGARRDASGFEVEPRRSDYHARGDGPYRYLIPKEGRAA